MPPLDLSNGIIALHGSYDEQLEALSLSFTYTGKTSSLLVHFAGSVMDDDKMEDKIVLRSKGITMRKMLVMKDAGDMMV